MKQESWIKTLLSFASPCKGKMVLSVLCAVISVIGGFVPYLGIYEVLRMFIDETAGWYSLLFWCGISLE